MKPKSNLTYILVISCLFVISCSKKDVPTPAYSAEEIIAFKQLNLWINQKIVKWPAQVSVYLVDTTFPHMTSDLDSVISEINKITGANLTITRTANSTPPNIQVHFTDRETYLQRVPWLRSQLENSRYLGFAFINPQQNGVINLGNAFVDMNKTSGNIMLQRRILRHEIMHTLGFIGHVTSPQISSVMIANPSTLYTSFDRKMMMLLYNPRILPNMKEAEFNSIVSAL